MNSNDMTCQCTATKTCRKCAAKQSCTCTPEQYCQQCFGMSGTGGDGPQGPMGPKGPAGLGTVQPFDPEASAYYAKGTIIWFRGMLWQVNVDNPSGTPGSSPDYTLVSNSLILGATGPTGPQGDDTPAIAGPYDPTYHYQFGDLIYYHGEIYLVNTNNPQGAPGSSADFSLVTGMTIQGVTGPTGPDGGSFPVTFDPNASANYRAGMVIYYNGNLYTVNVDDPQGVPGSSSDYTPLPTANLDGPTGPQGPEGEASAMPWSPDGNYRRGNVVYYNGKLYSVDVDNPQGTPDTSPDYTEINYVVGIGPTGPLGNSFPTEFDPSVSTNYPVGQLVYYQGNIYEVNTANPQGTPGLSSDYTLVKMQQAPIQGPPGIAGPQGPAATCGCQGTVDDNASQIADQENLLNTIKDQINNLANQINDTQNRINNDLAQAQSNADRIANLQTQLAQNACTISELEASLGKVACDNVIPFEVLSANLGGSVISNGTWQSQMIQQGQVVPTGGTFFGCKIYRAAFYGTMSNVGVGGTGYSSTQNQTNLLPSCVASAIVDGGGWYTDANGNRQGIQKGNFYIGNGYLVLNTPSGGGAFTPQINEPYYCYVDFTCCATTSLPTCPTIYCLDCSNGTSACTNAYCAQTQTGKCATSSSSSSTCNCANCTGQQTQGMVSPGACTAAQANI